jgi:membrane protein YdbS with pleckstrin-like domain
MNSTDPVEVVESAAPAETATVEAMPATLSPTRELRPHPQLLSVWIWGTLIFVAPAVLIALTVSMFADHWLIAPLAAIAGASIMAFVTLYGRAWLNRFRCRLLADGLWVDRGVWWRSETFVPRARVQHTDVQQGPIARRYGIASLKVFTAGAGHGEIEIDGLIHADALWLRDELLGRHGQDGV